MLNAENNNLTWWDDPTSNDGRILARLDKAEIQTGSSRGLRLKGYEPLGGLKFRYQEWLIVP
jgi:hypothetical protein